MNVDELVNNKGNKQIELAKGIFGGMRVLTVADNLSVPTKVNLNDYFDVIIAENQEGFQRGITPDVYIVSTKNLLTDPSFIQDGRTITSKRACLFVLPDEAVDRSNRAALSLNFPFLTYRSFTRLSNPLPYKFGSLSIGLSQYEPAVHLARIGNADTIYTSRACSAGKELDQGKMDLFITEQTTVGYTKMLKNIKCPNRRPFIETIKW